MNKTTFCEKQNYIIFDNEVKKDVITYLYKQIPLQKFRFSILNQDNLEEVNSEYYITINVTEKYTKNNKSLEIGRQYIFIVKDNNYYMIDKKGLAYNFSKINYDNVKIYLCNFNFSDRFNKGSILDGSLLKNKDRDWVFIVQDIYYLYSESYLGVNYLDKMKKLNKELKKIVYESENTFKIDTNPISEYKDIRKFVYSIIPQLNYRVNGLIFFPKISDKRYIYRFENNKRKFETNENIINTPITKVNNSGKTDKSDNYSIFVLKKTNYPDVYTLWVHDQENKLLKTRIARIPTIEKSHEILNYFELNKNSDNIRVNCVFSKKHFKWDYVNIVNSTDSNIVSYENMIKRENK